MRTCNKKCPQATSALCLSGFCKTQPTFVHTHKYTYIHIHSSREKVKTYMSTHLINVKCMSRLKAVSATEEKQSPRISRSEEV